MQIPDSKTPISLLWSCILVILVSVSGETEHIRGAHSMFSVPRVCLARGAGALSFADTDSKTPISLL
ncbi:hypothetical protein CKJ84_08210 [Corynebacterium sp. NML 120412]|nr:hypothetical protein CKJ84_08210 [Corynebacterium sp. NML 120412]